MDIDICQTCGSFLRQRLRFCTSCGSKLSAVSCTTLPKLTGGDLAGAAPVSMAATGGTGQTGASTYPPAAAAPALSGLSYGNNFYKAGKAGPDPECQNCTTFLANHQAAVLAKVPGLKGKPVVTRPQETKGDEQRDKAPPPVPAVSALPPTEKPRSKESEKFARFRDTASSAGTGSHAIADSGMDKSETITEFYSKLKDAIDESNGRCVGQVKSLAQKSTSLPNTLLIIGAIFIVAILSSLGSTPKPAEVAVPVLNGPWYFNIVDYKNARSYSSSCMLAQQGTELSGTGMESDARFIINGFYTFPRVTFVKTFIDVQYPAITFEGDVVPILSSGANHSNTVAMNGTWFSEGNLPRSNAQVWSASPQPIEVQTTIRPAVTNSGLTAAILGVPGQHGRPGEWAGFFLRIACLFLLLGLALIFLSVKMFGPAGMLNIWAKKEYVPSQFRGEHRKMLRLYGQPLTRGGVPLGQRLDWNILKCWQPRQLAIPPAVRRENPHTLIIGAGACGKSRLLASMIAHDIESADRSVVVVDSDGSLADLIVAWIAAHPQSNELAKRVVLIDPVGGNNNATFNPLSFPEDNNLQAAASALVFGFKAVYTEPPGSQTQWSQQTADILRNAAILLMANGRTLTDLPVLLSENDFRDVLLDAVEAKVKDRPEYSALIEAWARYKRMARTDQWINWIEPILNRVNPMLGDPRIRPILTSPQGSLNLKDILSKNKILLVRLPQGHLDQNANLLGSLLVTGLKQAALSLSGGRKNVQCSLYLDEFDNFIEKETFDSITSETRRFGLAFVGAAKSLQQLPEDYRNQLIINVGTLCCFALGKKDGDLLAPQMFRVDGRKIKHQTLQNIFNKVNTTPQFELITDEEKLNIDRVVGQEDRTYFCYHVGSIAGVFHIKAPDFADIASSAVKWSVVEAMHAGVKQSG